MAVDNSGRGLVPSLTRNPISIVGAWITTLGVFAFLTYLALERFGLLDSPYAGLFGYVVVPVFVLLGLLLIPAGVWVEGRRRRHGHTAWRWPVIDLEHGRARAILVIVGGLTVVNMGIVAVASVGAVHYSESNNLLRAGLPRANAARVHGPPAVAALPNHLRRLPRRAQPPPASSPPS